MSKKPTFVVSEQTARVVEVFSRTSPGETVTYAVLSALLGEDAQKSGRHHISSAQRIMLREQEKVFLCIPEVGMKHLTPEEVASLGPHAIKRTHRMAVRWRKRMATLKSMEDLDPTKVNAYRAHMVMLNYLENTTTHHKRQEVERRVANTQTPPQQDLRFYMGF